MRFARTDRSRIARWWVSIDRVLLGALLALALTGVLVSLAASPAVAIKRGLAPFSLVERHVLLAGASVLLMIGVSFLTPSQARRLGAITFAISLAGLVAVLLVGTEVNGARRWLRLGGHSLQPSEFIKPGFAILAAWLLADARRRIDVPAMPLAIGLLVVTAGLLVAEPDVGQTVLVGTVWGVLYYLSGQPLRGALMFVAGCTGGLVVLYATLGHVRSRIDRFFGQGDTFQVDRAAQSFAEGGLFGRGPGEGVIKIQLPDAHTDFIFAVIAEEFGAIACVALGLLVGFIVVRAMVRALAEPDPIDRLAITGLALFLALQSLINMGVNVGLLPAKGMTLPFISNGGSSLLAVGLSMGLLLALTRRRAPHVRAAPERPAPAGFHAQAPQRAMGHQ
ncbi:MAG: putative lipid II flippase FtsW [Hyphomicrobiales bacterium]|nr:putative lipid II flippase FtsW [Hyphomicrobiales bacterium]